LPEFVPGITAASLEQADDPPHLIRARIPADS